MTNIPDLIRQYATEEIEGIYTISLVIVRTVDHESRRADVSLMRDPEIVIDNVPIASPYAKGDGYGEVYPIEEGMEGIAFHTKEPVDELIVDPGHLDLGRLEDQFRSRDAVFFPTYWNENDTTPSERLGYEAGDYLHAHESGTNIWVKHDGTMTIETANGEQGMKLDGNDGSFKVLDQGGYGLTSDGGGNLEMFHSTFDFVEGSTNL